MAKSKSKLLEEKTKELEDLRNRMKYLQADFENYRKNLDKEKAEFESQANMNLVREFLSVIDDFEKVLENVKDPETKKGVEIVFQNMMSILEKRGLKGIEALDKKLDPYYHEAMLSEKSDKEEGMIIEELQKGYTFNSNVIRHSKVKIARK